MTGIKTTRRQAVAMLLGATALAAGGLPARAEDLAASSGETVYFRGWQFRTDVVQGNVDRYNSEMGGNVDYATVTGDYPSIMEKTLIAKGDLDVLYANPSSAVRYMGGGWVKPASELPNGQEIADAMYPNIREAWSVDGKLLGLSYFVTTRGAMLVNMKAVEKAGMTAADLPTTWDEFYDAVYKMHEAGIENPFLPHWFAEYFGVSWGFVFEVMNRGGQVADPETHAPVLTADGPAGDTLRAWKKLWKSGIIPEEVLSYNEAGYIDAFRSGRYAFSPQQLYDIKTFNDPAQSADIAGSVTLLSAEKQSWGLIDSALYVMTNRKRSAALESDVEKFVSWYGYKDQDGTFAVANRWLEENMLFSAYKPVMESDAARDSVSKSLMKPEDYDTVLDVYASAPYPKSIWNVVWSEEFNFWLRDKLFEFLQNDLAPEDVIDAANAEMERLNKRYNI
ncbi:ABC transporter substrate-binding protein [Mangrovicoccus sp. HB161399]|uniref:ABC transporter substrate-binding protein n=1 Tax=Mangrovicoccus sp. HB161399 TaxID=2720392 RepID=UPI001557B2AC|nr:extracellular solute-binding protein [Mangrovicoccus sp. HB161399]